MTQRAEWSSQQGAASCDPPQAPMSRHIRIVLAALFLGLPPSARAQEPPTTPASARPVLTSVPKAGALVRVTVQDSARRAIVGRLTRLTADSIELLDAGTGIPVVVARGGVERVETRAKRGSALTANGVVGGALGIAGSGYALWRLCRNGADCWTTPPRDENADEDEGDPMSIGAASLMTGAALGALLGFAVTPYGWKVTVLPYGLGSQAARPVRGLQVAVSFKVR